MNTFAASKHFHEPPRLIVTRPEEQARSWVAQLQQHGLSAQALPLIEIAAVSDVTPLHQAWQQLAKYAAVMLVSPAAVTHFFANKPEPLAVPQGLRYLAPGPGTVTALLNIGVPATCIDAPPANAQQFDTQTLWHSMRARIWNKQRVLLVRGQSFDTQPGRHDLATLLKTAGAQLNEVVAYQRVLPQLTAEQWTLAHEAMHDGSLWLFSSSQAVAHLLQLNQCRTQALDWSQARAIATHPRIAQALQVARWSVVSTVRPTIADIVASIESPRHES